MGIVRNDFVLLKCYHESIFKEKEHIYNKEGSQLWMYHFHIELIYRFRQA